MEKGVQLGLGEGPIKWVQCPKPVGIIDPTSRTLTHINALSEPTLLWAAKGDLYPHVGGKGSHRAR